jgi:taurine dioxygenase
MSEASNSQFPRTLAMTPLNDVMGMRVDGVDLSRSMDAETLGVIRAALGEHSLLLFRGQSELDPLAQIAFSEQLGELEKHVLSDFCLPGFPEIFVVSNIIENGRHIGAYNGSKTYHSDLAYLPEPSLGSVFRCLECPEEGGETAFISMYAVYDALPPDDQEWLAAHTAVFDYAWDYERRHGGVRPPLTEAQKRAVPPIEQPCVRKHPDSGRAALYVSPTWVRCFGGMSDEDSRERLDELLDFATQDKFAYYHQWQPDDVLVWDNRSSMHRVCPYDDADTRRLMHRTTVKGDRPIPW